MSYNAQATINHGQSANDADGIVTQTIPGVANDIVVLIGVINNATAVSTCVDNGDAGNPWTRLNSPNPDVISSNTNVSVWAKKLGATDVGKTVTYDGGAGGVRLPVAMAAFSGRSTVADIVLQRGQDTDGNTTFDPPDLVIGSGTGWDIVEVTAARVATATQLTMTGVPTNHTKRAEAATNFGASPNLTATITSRDNVAAGTYGTGAATFSASTPQVIGYTLGLKATTNAAPTANAGADQTNKASGSTVTITGSGTDTDGTVASYNWTQAGGPAVTLSGTGASRTFTVPTVASPTILTFSLTVTDNLGSTSAPDTMTVQAVPANAAPTASAGADQTNVEPWATVALAGTDSDSDGTIASRAWSVSPSGAATFLSGQTSANATAEVRGTIAGETITFTYSVTDNGGSTTSDTMTVAVLPVTERAAIGGVLVPLRIRQP